MTGPARLQARPADFTYRRHSFLKSSSTLPIPLAREAPYTQRELEKAMQIPGAHIVTLHNPVSYTPAQIDKAAVIAHTLKRGQFVLCEPPRR